MRTLLTARAEDRNALRTRSDRRLGRVMIAEVSDYFLLYLPVFTIAAHDLVVGVHLAWW